MCVIGLVGDTSKIDPAKVEANKKCRENNACSRAL